MIIKVHGGIISDQMSTGSLRYFQITQAAANIFQDAISPGLVATATIVNGGTGYVALDDLTVVGGILENGGTTAATLDVTTVSGGVITAIAVLVAQSYTELPVNPVSVTGVNGVDATFNLTYSTDVIIPGASVTGGATPATTEFPVTAGHAVPNNAADRVLAVVQERANIVQINVLNNDTMQIAVENTGMSWGTPALGGGVAQGGGGTPAAEMQVAIRALGTIGLGTPTSNDPPVPDTTTTGIVAGVDVSGLLVTEITTFVLV